MTPKLSLTLRHKNGETVISYTSRLAARNLCSSASDFCRDLGLDWDAIVRGDEAEITTLADLAGVKAIPLIASSVRAVAPGCMMIGPDIATHVAVNKSLPRVCPKCLLADVEAEGPRGAAGRITWCLTAVHRCHIHGCRLIVLPTSTFRFQDYDLNAVIQRNWSCVMAAASETDTAPETSLEKYLRRRVSGERDGAWPDQMQLHVVSRTAEVLGCRMLFGAKHRLGRTTQDHLREAGAAGFDVLTAGPDVLRETLRGFERGGYEKRPYHKRDYGMFFSWLNESRTSPAFDIVKDVVREHIFATYPREAGAFVLGKPVPERRYYTLEAAKRELGIGMARLQRLIAGAELAAGFGGVVDMVQDGLLSEGDVAQLRAHLETLITKVEAAQILNCRVELVGSLAKAGVLKHHLGGGSARYLLRSEVENLRDMVMQAPEADSNTLIDLHEVVNRAKLPVHDILRMIRDGRIRCHRRDPARSGLLALMLDPTEITSALRWEGWQRKARETVRRTTRHRSLTTCEAAPLL